MSCEFLVETSTSSKHVDQLLHKIMVDSLLGVNITIGGNGREYKVIILKWSSKQDGFIEVQPPAHVVSHIWNVRLVVDSIDMPLDEIWMKINDIFL